MSDRYDMAFNLDNMVPGPAGTATPKTIFKSDDGIVLCYGTTVPTDDDAGYAPGCIFIDVSGAAVYVNEGDVDDCDFDAVSVA